MKHEQIKRYYDGLYRENGDAAFTCDRERYTHWLNALPQLEIQGRRVLDIGCGAGEFVEFMARQGAVVTGTDISSSALAFARRRTPGGEFHLAQADSILPFPSGSFDLVTSFGVLEHIPTAPRMIAEASRVLAPGGHVLFVVPNRNSPYYLLGRGTGQIEETPRSRSEWLALFEAAGLEMVSLGKDRGPTINPKTRRSTVMKVMINRVLNLGPVGLTYQFVFSLKHSGQPPRGLPA